MLVASLPSLYYVFLFEDQLIYPLRYKLAQEHGDLINLHDWYQSFKEAVSSNSKSKHKKQQSPMSKKRKATHVPAGIDEASTQYPLNSGSEP